jgi:hypothetical protein
VDAATWAANLRNVLTGGDLDALSQFAAYQYLRVPGAIEQKAYELQPSELPEETRLHALNPGRFVESGFEYVRDRFKDMKLMLLVSPDREFLTGDWPCFDVKDSDDSPLLGEEIGRSEDVVCYFPLAPRVAALFHLKTRPPRFSAMAQKDVEVRSQNTLIIQNAERVVIASRGEQYVFAIAKKRKKGRPPKT